MTTLEKIKEYEENFEFQKAMEEYEKEKDKLSVEDLKRYAELLFEYQKYEEAKIIFEGLLEKDRENELLIDRLAYIKMELKENSDAKVLYEKIDKTKQVEKIEEEERFDNPKKEIIELVLERFSGREDNFALQWFNEENSGYYPKRRAIKANDIKEHIKGKKTIGIYQLKKDNTIKFAAYDIDIKKGYEKEKVELKEKQKEITLNLYKTLKSYELNPLIENSGNKGYHIWLFFENRVQSYKVKHIMEVLLNQIEIIEEVGIEIFPKQIQTKGGLGNLIKIPFGIHKKTGRRCNLVDEDFRAFNNQFKALQYIKFTNSDEIEKLYYEVKGVEKDDEEIKEKIPEIKKELRNEIKLRENGIEQVEGMLKNCHILKQLNKKIEREGYLIPKEEKLFCEILLWNKEGEKYLQKRMEKTINYSYEKLKNYKNQIENYPLSCRKIKEYIKKEGLSLDISKCRCFGEEVFPSPFNYIYNVMEILAEKLGTDEIIERIFKEKIKKREIEREINILKMLLLKKVEENKDFGGVAKLRKTENDIEIII